jgi:hypothetical protein
MKSILKLCGFILCGLLLVGCSQHQIKGDGKITTTVRQVAYFSHIQAMGAVNLTVNAGATQGVMVSIDDNLQPYLLTEVNNHRLKIYIKDGYSLAPSAPIHVSVTLPRLKSISLAGITTAQVTGINGKDFDIHCAGASQATLSGQVKMTSIGILGSATIDAKNLQADQVNLDVAGAAKASVYALKKMNVKISGAGQVTYYGNPTIIHQAVFGAGQIQKGK